MKNNKMKLILIGGIFIFLLGGLILTSNLNLLGYFRQFTNEPLSLSSECGDNIDNDNDGSIDRNGCDCNKDGEIETSINSQSKMAELSCETTPSNKNTLCKNKTGIWYTADSDCENRLDDSEASCVGIEEFILPNQTTSCCAGLMEYDCTDFCPGPNCCEEGETICLDACAASGEFILPTQTTSCCAGLTEYDCTAFCPGPNCCEEGETLCSDEELNTGISQPKIILVISDSLRADHLSTYGYERNTSPNIDAFASEGIQFSNEISQARWTLESFTSILSSLHTITHQATDTSPLDTCWETLPEVLQENGYETVAFSNGASFADSTHQGQGFDDYYWDEEIDETEMNEQVFDWLDQNHEDPFFMMVHYMSPHSPYEAPAPYADEFIGDEYSSEDNYPDVPICETEMWHGDGCIGTAIAEENITDIDDYVARYDEEISSMDAEFQSLLDHLDELGIKDDTLIIFTADHGEVFYRDGIILGHQGLYDDTLHVPLIIRYPSLFEPQIIDDQTQSIDIMPTIFDILNIEGPDTMQGNSLLPLIEGVGTGEETVFSGDGNWMGSIRNASYKLIEYIPSSDGETELYDLVNDPEELINIAAEYPSTVLELEAELQENIDTYENALCE